MAEDFKINIDAELDTAEAEKKLNSLLNEKHKITIDVDVSGQETSKKLKQNIENGIKNVKIDTSALSKTLADGFNISDKSTISKLQKQISSMMSQLGKSWNGQKFDISDGLFENSMTSIVNTIKKNAKVLRSLGAYDGFYDYFKDQKILVTDALKSQLGDVNYKELLNNNIGKLVTDTKKSTATINSMWSELSGKFPNLFPDNIVNQADQLNHVLDIWKKAQSEIKKISSENMNSVELGQVDTKAWESVVGIGAKMETALRQSITDATQQGKTTVDLDVNVNAEKISEDIRNAIKSASTGTGEALNLDLDINSEQLLTNLRTAIEKLGTRDEPVKIDIDVDKASLQEKLNAACKDMEIPVDFKIDSEDIASKIKAAVDNIQDIELDLKVNTDSVREAVNESIDRIEPDIDSTGLAQAQQILHGFNSTGQQTQSVFQSMGSTVREAFSSTYNVANLLQDGMNKVTEAGRAAVETVKEFNDVKVDLANATGENMTYVDNLMTNYQALAEELGTLTGSVAESADGWLRSGKSLNETNSLIKESLILSKDAGISSEKSTEILLAGLNGFQLASDEASKISDVINKIDLLTASSAEGLGESLTKVASMANLNGVSLEKTVAMLATIKDSTQAADATVGTSLKSIFSRINSIKAGKFVDSESGEALNDVEKVLNKVGISMRDVNGQFLDTDDILEKVADKWKTLDKTSQKAVMTALGGTHQANATAALLDNYNKVLSLTKEAENSSGSSLKKFEENYLPSLEAKTNSLKASLEGLSTSLISDDMYSGFLDGAKAITDFIDKTNLLKGSLAGFGTAGGLFVFQQIGMFIKEATTELSNLGNALNMLKVGNLGTNEFQKLLTLTQGLSDSQMELVLSSTALTDAQRVQLLTNAGVAQAEAEAQVAAMGLSAANGTATASTVSLSSAFKGLWATLAANPLILVAAGVTAAVSAYSSYQQSIKEAVQSASEAGQVFAENYSSLGDSISKVQELRTALASGTMSEEEAYQAKSDLLSIQNQLSDSYGDQADGIDLVNGKLDEQIEKMQQLAVNNANEFLNDEGKGISKAKEEMEKERYYSFGVIEDNKKNKDLIANLKNIAKDIDGIDIASNDGVNMFAQFSGDAETAEKSINEFMSKVRELKEEMEDNGQDTSSLDYLLSTGSEQLSKNKEILDDYQDLYKNALQADMISKGFDKGSPATVLNDYTQAVQDYNDALASGDTSAIDKAKTAFDNVQSSVEGVVEKYPEYKSMFDEISTTLDESTIKANDFKDAVKDMFEDGLNEEYQKIKDWGLDKYETQIKNGTLQSVFGNVDMDHRNVINWTLDEIENAKDQLKDIKFYDGDGNFIDSYYDQLKASAEKGYDTIDTVFGDVMEKIEGYDGITDIAFSHIVNNDDGTYKFLGQKTAQEYLYGILDAAKADGDLSIGHILELDKAGIKDAAMFDDAGKQVGETYIHGIISGFNENAADISALTHFAGKYGAIELEKAKNPFKDFTDVELKAMSIDGDNLDETQQALADVVDKAKDLNIITDETPESIAKVVDMLTDMGLTGSVSISSLTESFSQAQTSIQKATSDISSLQSLLSSSMSGKGMSADDVTAFKEMFGDDAASALEKTANGYHINQQALAKLQNQQKQSVKSDYLTAISEEQEALQKVNEQIAKAIFNGDDVSGLQSQKQSIESNISSLQDLAYQYQNAMSAYNQWQAAMAGGEEGDMYDSIQGNLESVKDLYDKGLVGENKFKEFVDLMSNQDLSNASVEQIVSAYEEAMPKIKRYFTEGQEGAVNFLKDIQNINQEWAHMNEDGSWDINFGVGNDQDIADALGIDVEAVQAILRKLKDYGFDVNLDQPVASLDKLKSVAESAKESLDGLGDTSLDSINLDSSSFGEVTDNIDKVKEYIQTINDSDLEPDVKTERLEQANNILEYLVQKQQEIGSSEIDISVNIDELNSKINDAELSLNDFKNSDGTVDLSVEGAQEAVTNLQSLLYQKQALTNNSAVISVDSSQVDGALGDAIGKIQEYQAAVNNLTAQTELQKAGVQIDTSDAQAKVQQLAGEIQGLDGETKASLGLDTSEFDSALSTITSTEIDVDAGVNLDTSSLGTIQSTISAISPEILVKAGVDSSEVEAYKAESEDKEGTVKFKVDSSAVDNYKPDDKNAKVTYSVSISGLDKIKDQTRNLTYNVSTKGSTKDFNGTANASGTAHASGDWSAPRTETALVGEIGRETIVRNGKYFTVGDNGAEFANIRKGDIIFNHKQTEELFNNGHVTSGGGRAKVVGEAFASGTAYSSANGRFNYGDSGQDAYSGSGNSSSNKSSTNTSKNNTNTDTSSSTEETKEDLDWIETKLDRIKRDIDLIDKTASSTYKNWSKRNEALASELSQVSNELNVQQQAYDRYMQQANSVGLSDDWASKVRDGLIDIETITDSDLKDKISDYKTWYEKALDCRDAIADLREQESKLYEQKFNNLKDEYDDILDQFDHTQKMLEGYIDLTEAQGYISSSKYYDALIENENEKLNNLTSKRNDLINSLDEALASGKIDKYSESWYDMQQEINSIDEAILDCNKNTVEWGNNIRQIGWDIFDKIEDRISDITDEADFLVELISSEDMYDDKNGGAITDYGKATIGLHGVKYNTYMQQADEYRKEMEQIQKELKSDPYNQDLIDRYDELQEKQRDFIKNAKDEKDAIKDLVEDGINAELDSIQKLIDKYTDLLDTNKDLYDYTKQLEEAQKNIASLEKQLAAYQGDNSEEGQQKRQQISNDLADARQDLEETQYERSIADQKKLLDDLYDDYEETLNLRLDNIDMLVEDVITNINSESSGIRETLETVTSNVGYTMTDSMNTIWSSANNVVTTYGDKFSSQLTGVQQAILDVKNLLQQQIDAANKKAQSNTAAAKKSSTSSNTTTTKPSTNTNTNKNTTQGNGKVEIGDAVTFVSGSYYYSSDGKNPTGSQMHGKTVYVTNINTRSWAKKKYHIAKDKDGKQPLGWVDLAQISGYANGTDYVPYDQLATVAEHGAEGIIHADGRLEKVKALSESDAVINNKSFRNLLEFSTNPTDVIRAALFGNNFIPKDFIDVSTPIAPVTNNVTANNTFNFEINVDKPNNYDEFYKEVMVRFQKDVKAEKLIQDVTFGKVLGKGNLYKNRTRF